MTVDKYVIEDYEKLHEELHDKVNNLAADLLKERSERNAAQRSLDELQRYVSAFSQGAEARVENLVIELVQARAGWRLDERRRDRYRLAWVSARRQRLDVRSALGESLGGSDWGLAGDVVLVVQQRDAAREALERVAGERDEARADAVTNGQAAERLSEDLAEARAEVVRLGRELEQWRQAFGDDGVQIANAILGLDQPGGSE